jgi:magnesium transporter
MKNKIFKTFGISKLLPRTGKIGDSPGTVQYLGKIRKAPVRIHVMDYNELELTDTEIETVGEAMPYRDSPNITWLNITGVHNEAIIHDIGETFNIHPLVLEDIANTTQRPKVEEYENYLFVIIKMVYFNEESHEVTIEQVSLIVGKNYVISMQEKEGDVLEGLRYRIRSSKGKIRKFGSDYLMYGIIDAVVDNYFKVLEQIGEDIEGTESSLMQNDSKLVLNKIYQLKQELLFLRKSVWPMREVVSVLQRSEHSLMNKNTSLYLRDVYDHTIDVVETVETFRDMTSGMLDLYLSTVSNRMNEIMKVLTIFAAIFIPLTFFAGVYGMNFEIMPELKWRLAYPVWWIIIAGITVGMIIYFKKKRWI